MPHEMIITEQHGRVGVIKFNNDKRMNALHPKMFGEARAQIEAWNSDSSVGAIVLTGNGRAFCAGADMGGWNKAIEKSEQGNGARREAPAESQESWTEFIIRSKPVICAINGPAIGAGLTITFPATCASRRRRRGYRCASFALACCRSSRARSSCRTSSAWVTRSS